jgi:hypothetical protein
VLSHAGYLGGSHYAQRWGLSAGVTALILALQPMLTAVVMSRWLHERLTALQMLGVAVGSAASRWWWVHRSTAPRCRGRACLAVGWALVCVTGGTLYQRSSAPRSTSARRSASTSRSRRSSSCRSAPPSRDSRSSGTRRSPAPCCTTSSSPRSARTRSSTSSCAAATPTSVTSLIYLTPPVAALVEWAVYGVPPTPTMWLGMAVACVGVAMVLDQPRGAVEDAGRRGAVVAARIPTRCRSGEALADRGGEASCSAQVKEEPSAKLAWRSAGDMERSRAPRRPDPTDRRTNGGAV